MAFSDTFLSELTARNEISDVVSGYVRLTKRTGANQFGLCPFHNEKTPSFSVNTVRQTYHCFGCGKGGGVINFIMEVENLGFREAVEFLAKRAGMQMPEEESDPTAKKRVRMLELNRDAARFFYEQLMLPSGAPAREYMAKRQISPAVARNFGLGFAPDGWNGMRDALRSKGYSDFEMLDAGLVKRSQKGSFYDAFRNRLMFPVIDVKGNVIGFSGRIIGDGEPKYLNSPDTLVFAKGRNLFALNLAKKSKAGYLILSEGNIDIVSLHQAGFDNAVASLGTALTDEQARLISQFTKEVVIAYDNDGAGMKASQKAIKILEKLELKVKVLRMTGAKDPDEFIKQKGPDAFRNLIEASENHIEYQLHALKLKYDLDLPEQKAEFATEASRLVARLPSPVLRDVYASRVAEMCGLKQDVIVAEVSRERKNALQKSRRDQEKQETSPSRTMTQSTGINLHFTDPAAAAAEAGVIRLLIQDPELIRYPHLPEPELFTSDNYKKIYIAVLQKLRSGAVLNINSLSADLDKDEMSLLISLMEKPELLSNSEKAMSDYCKRIEEIHRQKNGDQNLEEFLKHMKKPEN